MPPCCSASARSKVWSRCSEPSAAKATETSSTKNFRLRGSYARSAAYRGRPLLAMGQDVIQSPECRFVVA